MNESKNNKETILPETSISTQSNESRKYENALYKGDYSNVEEVETEQWEKHEVGPFFAVGKPGHYTLMMAGMAVSSENFKTVEEAQEYVDKKPWDLILIATAVYKEAVDHFKKQANGN